MTDQEKVEWFNKAVKFQVFGLVFLTMRSRKNSGATWVIEDISTGKILNSNLEWEDDLPPAKRDQSFIIRTRFDFDTSLVMIEQYKMVMAE